MLISSSSGYISIDPKETRTHDFVESNLVESIISKNINYNLVENE